MISQPSVTVHRNIKRLDAGFVDAARQYPSGYFADIQGRRGALSPDIRPIFGTPSIYGTAVTVNTRPDDNLAPYVALEYLKPGDVLVIATGGWTGSAVIGDLIVGMFRNAGVAAIVTDGVVRDIDGLEAVGVPVFARGLSPNSPQKSGPGEIGGSVAIGGVQVTTGDLIVGDRDGVVRLRAEQADTALEALAAVRAKEAGVESQIAKGMGAPGWVKDFVATGAVQLVD